MVSLRGLVQVFDRDAPATAPLRVMEIALVLHSDVSSVVRQIFPGLAAIVLVGGIFGIPRFTYSAPSFDNTASAAVSRPVEVAPTEDARGQAPSSSDIDIPAPATPAATATPEPAAIAEQPVVSTPATASPTSPAPAVPQPTRQPQDDGTRIQIPYRTQFDGSTYEGGNCGVAAIAMALEHYGQPVSTHVLRESINAMTGDWGADSGVEWGPLKQAVEQRGLATGGLYNADGGYRAWTMDDLLAETRQGRPVILLVRYLALPGHENAVWIGDHYIVFLGMTADGRVIYHDSAFRPDKGENGAYRITDQATFERAWSQTWIGDNRTAMAIFPK